MFKSAVCVSVLLAVVKGLPSFISSGKWEVDKIDSCEDPEQYDMKQSVKKFKVSRTEDAFNGTLSLVNDIDDTYSMQANIYQMTSGGWKEHTTLKDDCFLCFVRRYAEENFILLMSFLGLPAETLIPAGEYSVGGFPLNLCELPDKASAGEYKSVNHIRNKDGVIEGCVIVYATFMEDDVSCEIEK